MVSYLNLPEIFYLGVYQPSTGECEGDFDFTEYTSRLLNLKNCNSLVIEDFANCISSNLHDDFDCIVVVPPHPSGKDNSGIRILAQRLVDKMKLIDATSCLIRHKTIDKLSTGGSRSLETHLQSIKVVNQEFIKGQKLLMLDDVSTTGNSLKACQKLLESAGAKSVKCFVLGKTTRYEEDLGFFDWQYEVIKQSIEEEFAYLQDKLAEENYNICPEDECDTEMQNLSDALDCGDLSEEEFDYYAEELKQRYKEYCQEEYNRNINYEMAQHDADWQMQALNNLYEFSL
ncbi:phosphoribosyltransferase [Allocoleopsis sp.]|uniref:ComF family protein n=1 Tax=Allocoleopsis sp. TaxID=3088169 RepID=UPI002FD30BE9